MEFSESAVREMTSTVKKALKGYMMQSETPLVTDIHLQPLRETGELAVLDDDRELARSTVSEIAEVDEAEFYSIMEGVLRKILQNINSETPLELLNIWKPYSFVLTDDEGETISDLMLFDDETQLVSQTLMDGLDEDLEKFLKELLPD